MAYNTKPIVTDVDGNPISQYYNPNTDSYEPVEGFHGANKVLVENNDLSLIPILDKLTQLTGTIIDEETRKSNESQRVENEESREVTEDERDIAEQDRQSKEQTREEKEELRINNENNRVIEESERVSNENTRKSDENERISNEIERTTNEDTRVASETVRKSNELDRIELYNLLVQKLADGEFKGDKGDVGNGLEYNWDGTRLGVRVKGEASYVYVDLKGEKGDPGEIENLTAQHIVDALDYIPANEDDLKSLEYSELSSTATNLDDEGIYKNIEWRRKDNTLYAKSTLLGSYPYNQIKIDYYDEDGSSIIKTITWDLTYDDNSFPYTRKVI